ncbi:hypothetical protein DFH27DRAFT_277793 [Peziza echinospora]|nr:hypothetical protein DFH27DRAFT_277793 [Peziza echinospora]
MPSATLTMTYLCGVVSIITICIRLVLRVVVEGATNVHCHPHASRITQRLHASKEDAGERGLPATPGVRHRSTNAGINAAPPYRQRMFKSDDLVMAFSIIPLIVRMVTIHLVLICGTNTWLGRESNNMDVWKQLRQGGASKRINSGGDEILVEIDAEEARQMIVLGSKVVIVGRLAYAAFLWCMKICVLIFYQRIVPRESSKRYAFWIKVIWATLAVSFVGVLFATVGECRPFHLYWALSPTVDRCAYASIQLYTLGLTNIITDFALIVLPLPLIFKSRLPLMRKIHLTILFSIGLFLIAITITRLPLIALPGKGLQDARTLWASIEIGAACLVANAPVLYSLIRTLAHTFRPANPTIPTVRLTYGDGSDASANTFMNSSTAGTDDSSMRESRSMRPHSVQSFPLGGGGNVSITSPTGGVHLRGNGSDVDDDLFYPGMIGLGRRGSEGSVSVGWSSQEPHIRPLDSAYQN